MKKKNEFNIWILKPIMLAKVKNGDSFKRIMESVKDLDIVDTNIVFTESGLSIESMDSTHTTLVYLGLDIGYFSDYKCDRESRIGINIPTFCKILKACKLGDSICLSKSSIEEDYLCIDIIGDNKNNQYEIPEMDIEQASVNIKDDIFNFSAKVKSDNYINSINDLALVEGPLCLFSINSEGNIELSSSGDLGKSKVEITHNVPKGNYDRIMTNYSIKFLKNFIKSCCIQNSEIGIAISPDTPIRLSIDIDEKSKLKYYIAPRDED